MSALVTNPHPPSSRWQPSKMSWWYDAIIDLMMANPQMTKKDIAAELGATPAIIYMVTNSDIFKARYAQRRDALSSHLDGAIHSKLLTVADRSLGLIAEILDKKRDAIPLPQLESLADGVLNRLGYGAKPPPSQQAPVVVNLNDNRAVVVPVSPSDLDAARRALRSAETVRLIESPTRLGGGATPSLEQRREGALTSAQQQIIEEVAAPLDVAGEEEGHSGVEE